MEIEKSEDTKEIENEEKIKLIDSVVKEFAEKGEFYNVVEFMKLGASEDIINYCIKKCLQRGDAHYAKQIAELRGEKLKEEEIDPIVGFNIAKNDLEKAEKIARLGASISVRDNVVKEYLRQEEKPYDFWKKVIKLGPSSYVLDYFVKKYCEEAEFEKALKMARSRGKGLKTREINILMENCIKEGHFGSLIKVVELRQEESGGKIDIFTIDERNSLKEKIIEKGRVDFIGRWGIELEQDELDALTMNCIKKRSLKPALETVKLGASKKVINDVIMAFCKKGVFDKAQEAAALRGEELTIKEINALVRINCELGNFKKAQEIAELRGKLDFEEIENIIKANIEQGCLGSAQEVAEFRDRKLTTEELDNFIRKTIKKGEYLYKAKDAIKLGASSNAVSELVEAYCKKGDVDEAIKTAAKLDNRELINKEIALLIKVFKEKKETHKIRRLIDKFGESLTVEQIKMIKDCL